VSALCCILRHCSVQPSTAHSSGYARLELGALYFAILSMTFYGFIKTVQAQYSSQLDVKQDTNLGNIKVFKEVKSREKDVGHRGRAHIHRQKNEERIR
jgi:hypothetical protein